MITIGDTSGSNSGTLSLNNQTKTFPNTIVIRAGSSGTKSTSVDANASVETMSGPVTLKRFINSRHPGNQQFWRVAFTFSGPISGGAGGMTVNTTVSGTGQYVVFSGANSYSGPTIVTGGLLRAGVSSVAGVSGAFGLNSAVSMGNAASAILDLNNFNTQIGSLTGGGAAGGNVTLETATLTFGADNSSPPAYAGIVSGVSGLSATGGLNKIGTGVEILSGQNTYLGSTTINGGTLRAGAGVNTVANTSGPFGKNSAVTLANAVGVTLDINSTTTQIGSLSGGGATGGAVLVVTGTLTTGADNTNSTFAGSISGTGGSVVKIGSGVWTLSGTNSYTGGTTVSAGGLTLDYSTSNASPKLSPSGILTLGGATLRLNGGSATEAVASTTIAGGANTVLQTGSGSSTLAMGTIGRSAGGAINFGASGIATTTTANTNGILGPWATVGGTDWATNSGGSIVALPAVGYANINAMGDVVPDSAAANVRINAAGTSGNDTVAAATTTINTLLQNTTTAATIDVTSAGAFPTGILQTNGIMIGSRDGA